MSADQRIPEAGPDIGQDTGPTIGPYGGPIFGPIGAFAMEPGPVRLRLPKWAARPKSRPARKPPTVTAAGKTPKIDNELARRVAEAMALPLMACRRRSCRRARRCRWRFLVNDEPCCLQDIDAAQRRIFEELYLSANHARFCLGTHPQEFSTADGERRIRDETAIAIARSHSHRWTPTQWDAARRARKKRLPPLEE